MRKVDPSEGIGPQSPSDDLRLGDGPEFDLIRTFYPRGARHGPAVSIGPGDDAVALNLAGAILSTDLSVEDVHFRRDWLTPAEIGYRASAAALSDLAAMAARPIGILVSLAVPERDTGAFATLVMEGARQAAATVGGDLLGGDLSSSPGPMVIDVVVVGETAAPVARAGARPGDELWVTGELGGCALALEQLSRGEVPDPLVRTRFTAPVPRIREALWLAAKGIPTAMLDLSDGLFGDAHHLARASGLAVVLDLDDVPIHPTVAGLRPPDEALRLAGSGGEDYELLFAARPGTVAVHEDAFHAEFGIGLTRVGYCEAGAGVFGVDLEGVRSPLSPRGFQHFGGTG